MKYMYRFLFLFFFEWGVWVGWGGVGGKLLISIPVLGRKNYIYRGAIEKSCKTLSAAIGKHN